MKTEVDQSASACHGHSCTNYLSHVFVHGQTPTVPKVRLRHLSRLYHGVYMYMYITRDTTSALILQSCTCTVRIAYRVGGYSNIPDIVINFSNSFSFAITKYTQLSRIVIIVYSNISPIVIKFIFQKTFITLFLHRL